MTPQATAAALAFALTRCISARPLMMIVPRRETLEFGRPSLHGTGGSPLLMAAPRTLAEALWTMEQALASGALGGVLGVIEGATLTQSRRLDFAAQNGRTPGLLLRTMSGGLSAARRRWRIAALPSAPHPFDATAPGAPRLRAELVRRRDGSPGAWTLEYDAAAGSFAVVAELAADRPDQAQRRAA